MNYTLENFISYCDEMQIANEKSETLMSLLSDIIEFNKSLNNMEYIIVTKDKTVISQIKETDFDNYITLTSSEFIKYNGGICWDYVMYEAKYFSSHFKDIRYKTFFINNHNNDTHTILLFYIDDKCYWFESSWKKNIGIYEFDSEDDALSYIIKQMICTNQSQMSDMVVKEYNALDSKLTKIPANKYIEYMKKLRSYNFKRKSFIDVKNVYDAKAFFNH